MINYFKTFFFEGNQRSIKAKKNIIASFGIKGAALLIGFIKVPILLSYLNVDKYGIWLTIASIVDWIQYFDLGIGHGLRNKFAEALVNDNKILARKLVSTTYYYISIIFLSICILLIPVVYNINWQKILNTEMVEQTELVYSVLIVLVMFIFRFILYQISVILKADQRPAISDVFLPIANIITLGIVLLIGSFSKDSLLLACMAISIPPVLILLIANIFYFKRDYSYCKPSLKYVDKSLFKDTFTLGMKFFIIQIAGLVMFASSNIILTQIVNPSEVSLYNITRQYFNIPYIILGIILTPFWSATTDAYIRNDFEWIKNVMKKLLLFSGICSIGVVIMLIISPFVYKVWLGNTVDIPYNLSLMTAILFIFYIIFSPFSSFINGVGKLNLSIIVGCIKMVVYIPLAIYLTKMIGASGLVLAIILVNSIPAAILEPIQYRKIINRRAKGIWNK